MTVSLSSGPITGVLTGVTSSPVFSTDPGQTAYVGMFLSRQAAHLFKDGAVTLLTSSDGISNWTVVNPAPTGGFILGDTKKAAWWAQLLDEQQTFYKVQANISSGSIIFCANSKGLAYPFVGLPVINDTADSTGPYLALSVPQALSLINLKLTPLALSQIALPLTLYKQCCVGCIATLTVPAGVDMAFDCMDASIFGANRAIRAASAQVMSLVDEKGSPISSARSIADPGTTYTVGSTVNARDLYAGTPLASTGAFTSTTNTTGIHGFTTLLEAACAGTLPEPLAALGL